MTSNLSRHHLTLPSRIANSTECNVSWFQVALLAHIPKCAIGVDKSERSKGCVHHLPTFQLKKILHLSPISIRSLCCNVCFSTGWPKPHSDDECSTYTNWNSIVHRETVVFLLKFVFLLLGRTSPRATSSIPTWNSRSPQLFIPPISLKSNPRIKWN